MDDLRVSDFVVGDAFEVEAGGQVHVLTVRVVEELPRAARDAGGFRLEFAGPSQPILEQAIYTFRGSRRSDDIFIVPVAADANGATYEAIFI
ncbi:MAG TPA: hypothetical protein VF655_09370 [Allosphingosinicella sp.]|jgi:hypothetical protein